MAKERQPVVVPETVISIIGPGMKLVGDVETDGTVRIEGSVKGNVRAGKAVVIGKDGSVDGSVITQDAVISGRLTGKLTAESRLELQATSRIDGEVYARRMQLEEGAVLNGTMHMGDRKTTVAGAPHPAPQASPQPGAPATERPLGLVLQARAASED